MGGSGKMAGQSALILTPLNRCQFTRKGARLQPGAVGRNMASSKRGDRGIIEVALAKARDAAAVTGAVRLSQGHYLLLAFTDVRAEELTLSIDSYAPVIYPDRYIVHPVWKRRMPISGVKFNMPIALIMSM